MTVGAFFGFIMKLVFACLIFLSLLIPQANLEASTPRPFTTDFCTGYFDGTLDRPGLWEDCCVAHDLLLWAGGTTQDRTIADLDLKFCVKEKGAPTHSVLMWLGVRIGSLSPVKLEGKHWGNAWGDEVRKTKLSPEEIDLLTAELKKSTIEIKPELTQDFLEQLKRLNLSNGP